jgi:hypothetical protein
LSRIARDAQVNDVRVHPHAFRHTLVGTLVSAGNSLDVIAKFLGHASAATTAQFYFTPTASQLEASLQNPFAARFQERESQKELDATDMEVANAKVKACKDVVNALVLQCRDEASSAKLFDKLSILQDIQKILQDL